MELLTNSDLNAITRVLARSGFSLQQDGDGHSYFVRPSDVGELFERIELSLAGRQNEVILPTIALAVVQSVETQLRGLIERGGLEELCTDPENGRVAFSSREAIASWIEQLATTAPERVRAFAVHRGEGLLERTRSAREAAARVHARFLEPDVTTLAGNALNDGQRQIIANLSTHPFVIGSADLLTEYEVAITALTLAEDEDILRLGQSAAATNLRGLDLIRAMKAVPDATLWKIRVLVDMMLRARSLN